MQRIAINPENGEHYEVKQLTWSAREDSMQSANSIYRDRISGNREGRSVIAWYLQPLPDTRPSYSKSEHKPVFA